MAAPYFFESKDFRAMIVSPCRAHLWAQIICQSVSTVIFNMEIALFPS